MFEKAASFNGDVSRWNTGSVDIMSGTFRDAVNFNGDISKFDTGSTRYMGQMFYGCTKFNGDLAKWRTDKVVAMGNIFVNSGFNRTVCGGAWLSLLGTVNAFNDSLGTSTARYGCCPIGSFMSDPLIDFAIASSCTLCPGGKLGTFPNDDSQEVACENCDAGQSRQSDAPGNICIDCPAGTNSSKGSLCLDCPQGLSSSKGSSNCNTCPAGRYLEDENAKSVLDCTICPEGKVQPFSHLDFSKCSYI